MVKEQALRRKVTERGWQEEKCNVILAISISIERSGQTSIICWMHRVGLCSEEGSCSWGILSLSTGQGVRAVLTLRGQAVRVQVAAAAAAKSLQSCSTLCDPIDSSPLGSKSPG